jgi:malonyl CoA-acyl carrier protein transacylase
MNTEDEEFNRIERESKQRMEAVTYNLNRAVIQEAVNKFRSLVEDYCKVPLSFKNTKRQQIVSEVDEILKKL